MCVLCLAGEAPPREAAVPPVWWLTEFSARDGARYLGPQVRADCREAAEAVLSILRGPGGEALAVAGRVLATTVDADGDVQHRIGG